MRLLIGIFLSALIGIAFGERTPSDSSETGNWPFWRGPYGNGIAEADQQLPLQFSESENVVWRASVPGRGHSSPVVYGDRLFLTTAIEEEKSQYVLGYDVSSGERLWEREVLKGVLPENIHIKNTHATSTVAVDGKRVFSLFLTQNGLELMALDFDGEVLWRVNAGPYNSEWGLGYGASPILAGSNVIVVSDGRVEGFVAAFDGETGDEVWRTPRETEVSSFATPALGNIGGVRQILLSGSGKRVAGYDPLSGRELWSVPGGTAVTAGTMVWNDRLAFASGGYPGSETWATDPANGTVVWTHPSNSYEQSMILIGDHLYAVGEGGLMHCWVADTGEVRWRERLPEGPESASLVYAGGNLFHANEEGEVFVIKPNPNELELVAQNKLGDEIFATPAVCRNRMYFRVAYFDGEKRSESLFAIGFSEK